MSASAPALRIRGLTKSYGDVAAVNGLDLEVGEGEIFGLLGPNGAGKTTTVRIATTLEAADQGEVEVLGHDVRGAAAQVRAAIGYVPQELSSDRYLTARENLALFADLYHLTRAEKTTRIAELLDLLGLTEFADRRVRGYSGGMRKKLDLAMGLVHRPRLLFLDEPSLGLDVQVRRAVWDYVRALGRSGTTVFLCTNYMDEADALADRVAILDHGRLAALGSPQSLRAELGGDVVSIELADEALASAAEGKVRALDIVQKAWRESIRVHATVRANETALPALLEALRGHGIAAESVSYHRPGLEEVFLHHTGHRFVDATGTSGPPKPRRG